MSGRLLMPTLIAYSLQLLGSPGSHAESSELKVVRIAGRDHSFATIQAAVDAGGEGAVIEIPAGRFEERVVISKQVTLMGAGADQTIIGPTAATQANLRQSFERISQSIDAAARAIQQEDGSETITLEQTSALKRQYEEMRRVHARYVQPVIKINSAAVCVRSLTVTMPDTPQGDRGLTVTSAIAVSERGGAWLEDCAVVGCLASGITAEDGGSLEVSNCLIAACWGTGIFAPNTRHDLVRIVNCDVRNNYHYNITVGAGLITNCRISGSAWSGISGGASRVERNAIFENARTGIYSVSNKATVKHNLVFRNGVGASCWAGTDPKYQGNLFLENINGAFYVNGPCSPALRSNLIVGSPLGIRVGPMKVVKGEQPPAEKFQIDDNVFWRVDSPMVLFKSNDLNAKSQDLPLPANAGNRVVDPLVAIGQDKSVVLSNDSVADELGLVAIRDVSLRSRWPLTPEEQSMIPDDGTRDSSKWKMRPKP